MVEQIITYSNWNCMLQECYLRNKGKITPKPKKCYEAPAEFLK